MNRKWILGSFVCILVAILSACSSSEQAVKEEDNQLQVVASFYPMYDFAKNIVGDEGKVEMMIAAGTEAHDYEPSAKDLAKLQSADVFIYNNENMEVWVPAIQETLQEGNVHVIKATGNMLLMAGQTDEHEHEEETDGHSHALDPHVWLAPNLAMKEVEEIRDQLIKAYPKKKEVFTNNAEEYLAKLKKLDQEYRETFQNATQKSFVTQHTAFGYLALEYGLNQVPILGLSPNEEPSARRLMELKEFVKENELKYIYFEENATDRIAKTLADEAGVKLLVLNPLEGLTDKQINAGDDYVSVMRDNLKALSKTTNAGSGSKLDQQPNEKEKTVQNGYFEDQAIKDRSLSDWKGKWQSVYPYLTDGSLDQVFDYKAKMNKDKSADEYKQYYKAGYETIIKAINITDSTIEFIDDQNKSSSSAYKYVGYKILDYKAGNRGVRYCFEAEDPSNGAFKYIQFSDHAIEPTKAAHYHLYFGNDSQDSLLSQMENWPTYYPAELTSEQIAQEMLAH